MKTARLIAAAVLGMPLASLADPDYEIFTPNVEYGEREIDMRLGTERFKDPNRRESAASISFAYGATQWWYTEAHLKYHRETGDRTRYDGYEWENRFQLTEHNEYPVDLGLVVEFEVPRARKTEGYELRFGPMFQTDTGPVRWNANLLFGRHYRGEEPSRMGLGYQLQARHDLSRSFGVGFQALGDLGRWNHWAPYSEQEHLAGPAIFGRVKLGGRNQARYNVVYLFKASEAAPENRFRVQIEYEF